MEDENYLELYNNNKKLINDFITSNSIKSFKKLLNARTIPREKKCFFQSPLHVRPSDMIRKFKLQQQYNNPHSHPHQPSHTSSNKEDDNLNINRYRFIEDPDMKSKGMKGNYKWGSQKFRMIKFNLAKRKGIPFREFQMPKTNMDNIKHTTRNVYTEIHTTVSLPKI